MKYYDFLQNVVEPAIERKKLLNLSSYGSEYIKFDPSDLASVTNGEDHKHFGEKTLRIQSDCVMTVEYCSPTSVEGIYNLALYTALNVPDRKKVAAIVSSEDDDLPHRHDYYELIYVIKGHRLMSVEGKNVDIREGQLLIFDMQMSHLDLRSLSEGEAIYLGFTRREVDTWFLNHLTNEKLKLFFSEKTNRDVDARYVTADIEGSKKDAAHKCFYGIFSEINSPSDGTDRLNQVFILRLLNLCSPRGSNSIQIYEKKLSDDKLYQAVIRYIYTNIAEVTLEDLVAEFHYQKDYYNRLIKKRTSLTFSQYVSDMRLDRAKNLLINTDLPVREIREYLGYASHTYFYKIFSENTGLTPAQFRKNHRNN